MERRISMDKIIRASNSHQNAESRWLNQSTIISATPVQHHYQIQRSLVSKEQLRDGYRVVNFLCKVPESDREDTTNVLETSENENHNVFNPQPPQNYMWPYFSKNSLPERHILSHNESDRFGVEHYLSKPREEKPLIDDATQFFAMNSVALSQHLERIQRLKPPETLRILKPLFQYLWKLLSGQSISKANCYLCPSEQSILESFISRKYPSLVHVWPSS